MQVERIKTEHGSHIEPRLEQWWSKRKKLEWHAAVIEVDSGIPVRVSRADYSTKIAGVWIPNPGYYDVSTGRSSCGPLTYDDAWSYLNGIAAGASAVRNA
jgi:hypothetical protein